MDLTLETRGLIVLESRGSTLEAGAAWPSVRAASSALPQHLIQDSQDTGKSLLSTVVYPVATVLVPVQCIGIMLTEYRIALRYSFAGDRRSGTRYTEYCSLLTTVLCVVLEEIADTSTCGMTRGTGHRRRRPGAPRARVQTTVPRSRQSVEAVP